MMPTPTARDYKDTTVEPAKHRPEDTDTLNRAIAHLLPTPTVNDMGAGKDPQKWQEWTEEMRQKHGNGNGHGRSLEQEAVTLLPTPRAQARDRIIYREDYHHNLEEALAFLGDNMPKQSNDGNTSSDDQPQTPQLWDQQADPG
jgi:hypothetical protein